MIEAERLFTARTELADTLAQDVADELMRVIEAKGKATLADVAGRGGTDMVEGIRVALELRPKPTAIVVVTDGGTPWPLERLSTPVVACLVGSYAERSADMVPDWITTIVVD